MAPVFFECSANVEGLVCLLLYTVFPRFFLNFFDCYGEGHGIAGIVFMLVFLELQFIKNT